MVLNFIVGFGFIIDGNIFKCRSICNNAEKSKRRKRSSTLFLCEVISAVILQIEQNCSTVFVIWGQIISNLLYADDTAPSNEVSNSLQNLVRN